MVITLKVIINALYLHFLVFESMFNYLFIFLIFSSFKIMEMKYNIAESISNHTMIQIWHYLVMEEKNHLVRTDINSSKERKKII